jgi:cytochrome c-type biogenesis protein CcmH/NrfF
MKVLAEKSSQRRRHRALPGGRAMAAQARFFRRLLVTSSLAALLAVGASTLLPQGAAADEPAVPPPTAASAPASTPTSSTLPPEEIERQAESIARSIMSPFCPGRTVSACPVAGPWRDDIRRWVAEGVDALEIKRRLAERVPEHNLGGAPKNRLGWVLPVGLGIGAFGLLIFLLRRLVGPGSRRGTSETKAAAAPSPVEPAAANPRPVAAPKADEEDYDARLREELETLDDDGGDHGRDDRDARQP